VRAEDDTDEGSADDSAAYDGSSGVSSVLAVVSREMGLDGRSASS
jgi:hypothetical protein